MSEILECGHEESSHSAFTRGYGTDAEGKRHCYACCADQDRAAMICDGHITLYLVQDEVSGWRVTNWPASLVFRVSESRQGGRNMARTRHDVWFTGPDGHIWHGVQYGDDSQLCYCRRVKS